MALTQALTQALTVTLSCAFLNASLISSLTQTLTQAKFVFVYCLQTKLLRCSDFKRQIKNRSWNWVDDLDKSANHYAFIRARKRTDGYVGCAGAGACGSNAYQKTSANLYQIGETDLDAAIVSYVP